MERSIKRSRKFLKISTIYYKNWSQDTNLRKSGEDSIDAQSAQEFEKENKARVPWISHDKLIKELA